ncbi:hypothetical protein MBLNU13_g08103t1 [Cladosporium sp. NU13]
MTHRARFSGAIGTVVDGNFRDLEEHRKLNYPVFARDVATPAFYEVARASEKMSTSLYLELPWQGKRQMFSDIAGFVGVTLLLILIDSYILCEQQNASRIFLSIGIDYAILFVYIAARNVVTTSNPDPRATTQQQIPQCQVKQQGYK